MLFGETKDINDLCATLSIYGDSKKLQKKKKKRVRMDTRHEAVEKSARMKQIYSGIYLRYNNNIFSNSIFLNNSTSASSTTLRSS